MMPKHIKLSQAMNARLCHDLSANIGAINNSLGLIDHQNKNIGIKAKGIAIEESDHLVSKIKFFRSAYGMSDGETDISLISMTKLLVDFFKSSKVQLNLHFEEGIIFLEAQLAKAAICLTSIVSENIGHNGELNLYLNKDKNNPVKVLGNSNNIMLKEENLEVLHGEPRKPINVINCREHYINNLCTKGGYQVLACRAPDIIEYKILKK